MTRLWYILLMLMFILPTLLFSRATVISLLFSDLFSLWLLLEVSTFFLVSISFIHISQSTNSIKVLVIQTTSASFLIWGLVSQQPTWLILGLIIKLGIAPFSFWWFRVLPSSSLSFLFLFRTLYKIPSILFLFQLALERSLVLIVAALVTILLGSLGGVYSTLPVLLVIWSSLMHTGWIIIVALLSINTFLSYLIIYFFTSIPLYTYLHYTSSTPSYTSILLHRGSSSMIITVIILLLSSIPPTPTFFLKWWSLKLISQYSVLFAVLILVISSVRLLWYLVWSYQNSLRSSF